MRLSAHFASREPSSIRLAQIEHAKRTDGVAAVNVAIGNVSLPIHPMLHKRLLALAQDPALASGVVQYTPTVGLSEANAAFLRLIAASGFTTEGLLSQVVDGGSHGMELALLGVGEEGRPILVWEPVYANYISFGERLNVPLVAVERQLTQEGTFSFPSEAAIRKVIEKEKPGAMVVIPYDNPTGQFLTQGVMDWLGRLCVEYDLWLISDEAYRELQYMDFEKSSSVWGITEAVVPGITGRRISLESASKVWNACGMRIGAVVTDNEEFHRACVAENTANLCAPYVEQYVWGGLAHESQEALREWFGKQREYYARLLPSVRAELLRLNPRLIVSKTEAALYMVVDVRSVVSEGFSMKQFCLWCAREGKVAIDGKEWTLLLSPMDGFYVSTEGKAAAATQLRIACVESPERMQLVPKLLTQLLADYSNLS